jgi:hypothetical protein
VSALNAGAGWQSIGDVLDVPVEQLRRDFRQWLEGQRARHDAMQKERPGSPPIGMSAAQGEAAAHLAEDSDRDRQHGRCRE